MTTHLPLFLAYFNPYSGQSFIGFFAVLFRRIWELMTGQLALSELATDEIQIIVLFGIASSAALVGSFLVLRKMTMLANSLSHTILLGMVGAYLFSGAASDLNSTGPPIQAMLCAALFMGILTAFLTEFLSKTFKLQEDASMGIVFTSLFALGVIFLTLVAKDAHIGTEAITGNIDALNREDCLLALVILALNLVLFALFFKEYEITTFDPHISKVIGISPLLFNYLLMSQVSATAIGAFRAVGVLLVLAFMTGPALTARMLTHDLKTMLGLAVALGCAASLIGVALARHLLSIHGLALSTGGLVVCTLVLMYIATAVYYSTARGFFDSRVPTADTR